MNIFEIKIQYTVIKFGTFSVLIKVEASPPLPLIIFFSLSRVKVWCYVDPKEGNPTDLCPDALPSKNKPGYFWSRIACITN